MSDVSPPLPTFFIPHGGGPCFFMDWDPPDIWNSMAAWLTNLSTNIKIRPKAILVISAHWEENEFTITGNPKPDLIYDYSGFPEHTYQLTYPAPGAPALAQRAKDLLSQAGLPTHIDPRRGFDHGVFIPFKLIYPDADIPVIQLSLKKGLDPALHIAAGEALSPLRQEGVLFVGSGMSYHNMRGFFGQLPDAATSSQQFDDWLKETIANPDIKLRNEHLRNWANAPAARKVHPREEHLLPLMVISGIAGNDIGKNTYKDQITGLTISGYQFGNG